MSTPPKKRVEGGRVTPKGGPSGSRYNAPTSPASKTSPTWVPVLMFGLLALGIVIIFFNYVGWMPGGMKNIYLMIGLGSILGGILTATRFQ
jgi:hypothetical protein